MYLIQFPDITGSPRPMKIQRQFVHESRPELKCLDLTHCSIGCASLGSLLLEASMYPACCCSYN